MASDALEEKINKIRLQNEEIRRRYEEVEADKKNAAKLNALVQLVPSDDWPERREPPEFTAPPKTLLKQNSVTKDRVNERPSQHYSGIQERLAKKDHKFAEGEGPPPDPKYNFLADSERETRLAENSRSEEEKNKSRNRTPRGGAGPRRRGGGNNVGGGGSRDAFFKDNRGPLAFHSREESLPEYEAWRAERDRIDEARINRQKTAEGNWRREWDCNKVSLEKDQPRRDFARKDSNMFDRRNNHYDNDYSNRGHGGSRTYHQSQKNYTQDYRHPHHEQPHEFKRQQSSDCKTPLSPVDNRTVAAFDQSIKVTVNQGGQANKPAMMSVKVNSPSIAGTGRVGPRQKSRITYSTQSEPNAAALESNSFMRQKSFDEKTAAANFNNGPKLAPKSPFSQRKREGNAKSPYFSKKEFKSDESARPKSQPKASHSQRNESRDQRQSNNFVSKPQRTQKRKLESNQTGNVFVVEDSVPVENNVNQPLNTELNTQSSIECETNEIDKEISDVSNVLDNSAVENNDVSDDIDGNVSFDNEENVEYDSNIVNDDNETGEQFVDAEENRKNIKIDNDVKVDENTTQNNETFDVYSCLVNESIEVDDSPAKPDKESLVDHDNFKISNEIMLAAEPTITETVKEVTTEVETETSINTQSLDHEIKEVTQTLDDLKNEKVDIDLTLEKKESNVEEQCEEKITSNENESEIKNKEDDIDLTLEKKESAIEQQCEEKLTSNETENEIENKEDDIDLTVEKKENNVEEQCEETITSNENQNEIKNTKVVGIDQMLEKKESAIEQCEEKTSSNENNSKVKNTEVDVVQTLEMKESVIEEQCEEKVASSKDEDDKGELQQSNDDSNVEDSKVEDNSSNDLIESEENTLTDNSLNKPDNDSGFLDNVESDPLNKTSTTTNDTSNDSAILSDSNIVEDLDIINLDKSGAENKNEETSEPAKSESVETTKDVCEKAVEICDNVSVIASDMKMDESKEKADEAEKVNEILEDSIKDNDAKAVESDHQSSDASNVISSQEANVDTIEKKLEQVSENSVEVVSEESK